MLTAEGLGIYVNEIQRSLNGLGDVPNDFEAGPNMCYTPVWQSWYYGVPVNPELQRRPLPLRPPRPVPLLVPPPGQLGGNGDYVAQRAVNGDTEAQKAVEELTRIQKRLLGFQIMASVAVTALATISVVQAFRGRGGI